MSRSPITPTIGYWKGRINSIAVIKTKVNLVALGILLRLPCAFVVVYVQLTRWICLGMFCSPCRNESTNTNSNQLQIITPVGTGIREDLTESRGRHGKLLAHVCGVLSVAGRLKHATQTRTCEVVIFPAKWNCRQFKSHPTPSRVSDNL